MITSRGGKCPAEATLRRSLAAVVATLLLGMGVLQGSCMLSGWRLQDGANCGHVYVLGAIGQLTTQLAPLPAVTEKYSARHEWPQIKELRSKTLDDLMELVTPDTATQSPLALLLLLLLLHPLLLQHLWQQALEVSDHQLRHPLCGLQVRRLACAQQATQTGASVEAGVEPPTKWSQHPADSWGSQKPTTSDSGLARLGPTRAQELLPVMSLDQRSVACFPCCSTTSKAPGRWSCTMRGGVGRVWLRGSTAPLCTQ